MMTVNPVLSGLIISALMLAACSDAPTSEHSEVSLDTPSDGVSTPEQDRVPEATDGRLVISALPKVSEPNACILPITVTNGTDKPATISMMQFTIEGPGEDDSGNMFAQTVAPGDTNTASLLFPTRDCADLREIVSPVLKCTTDGVDCTEDLEFESTEGLSFPED